MSSRPPRAAVVASPVLDLRRRPDHASEMRSQLLMGETVVVTRADRSGRWWLVVNDGDGYRGWVRSWGMVGAPPARVRRWRRRARARVVVLAARVRSRPGSGLPVSPLPWNARVIAGAGRGAHRRVELPDGRRGWVERDSLTTRHGPTLGLFQRVESLLGVPYLWGGRSAAAFDCSGFVQQVLVEQGIHLPRDVDQQHRATSRLRPGSRLLPGDLLFFALPGEGVGHVAVVLGGGYFAHAQGRVRLGSMDQDNPLYDKALASKFVVARRVPGGRVVG